MKHDCVYLRHIRDAIDRVLEYTSEGEKSFYADPKTQDAAVRNLEVIGEGVKNLSEEVKAEHTDVPWRRIAGMRDKMIHQYFGLNLQLVWETIRKGLPTLRQKIDAILELLGHK